jgi:hypothetical protein
MASGVNGPLPPLRTRKPSLRIAGAARAALLVARWLSYFSATFASSSIWLLERIRCDRVVSDERSGDMLFDCFVGEREQCG